MIALIGLSAQHKASAYCFGVRSVGHGPPIIFIPGIACSGQIWDSTVEHYKGNHQCIELTLPGCAGQPPIAAPILPKVRDQIIRFIADRHLENPVLVGEGVGANLALWIAAKAPAKIGKLVCLGYFTTFPEGINPQGYDSQAATRAAIQRRSKFASESGWSFYKEVKALLSEGTSSEAELNKLMWQSRFSDPKATGELGYELYTTDFKSSMRRVAAPALMMYAFDSVNPAPDDFIRNVVTMGEGLDLIPHYKLVYIEKMRTNFFMIDAPQFFVQNVDPFLAGKR